MVFKAKMVFNEWLDILLYKKKPKDIAKTTLSEGLKHIAIASAITGFLVGLSTWISMPLMQGLSETGVSPAFNAMLGPSMLIMYTVLSPIVAVISSLIVGGLLHLFSLLLGGKGKFENYVGVLAKIDASLQGTLGVLIAVMLIIAAFLGLGAYLAAIPIVLLIALILAIWSLVLTVLATQAVQKLSLGKSMVAVIVIPLAIGFVITVLLVALLLIVFVAVGTSGSQAGLASLAL
jgi:hypothetical protein